MSNVFWYYVGRAAQHVHIDGESRLISPHSFFLAPAAQKFPPHVANQFKRKNPPDELRKRFELAGVIASEHQQKVAQETEAAEREKAEAKKLRDEARRHGQVAVERMPLSDAIKEEGKKSPKPEPEEVEQPKESKAERRKRRRGQVQGNEETKEEQGDES